MINDSFTKKILEFVSIMDTVTIATAVKKFQINKNETRFTRKRNVSDEFKKNKI